MDRDDGLGTVDQAAAFLAELYTGQASAVAREELAFADAAGVPEDAHYWADVLTTLSRPE